MRYAKNPYSVLTEAKESAINRLAAHNTPVARSARDPRIEALRLVAAVCIAVFHTFMPWFSGMCAGEGAAAGLVGDWAAAATLGFVNLLGAYGNHIFFLISGLFLVPAAARAAVGGGYWRMQSAKVARRAVNILAPAVLWCAVALALSTWVLPIEGVSLGQTAWFVGGLEFIWVYLACAVAAPIVGWIWNRFNKPQVIVAVLLAALFGINAWIAFVSPGGTERGLLDWRKLMSAVTYFAAFLAGGALAGVWLSRDSARRLLTGIIGIAIAVEALCAVGGRLDLMAATSFKSTSLLSFGLAVASVLFARSASDGRRPRIPAAIPKAAASILDFYVLQSLTNPLWSPAFWTLTGAAFAAADFWPAFAVGILASLALLAAFLLLGRLRKDAFNRLSVRLVSKTSPNE